MRLRTILVAWLLLFSFPASSADPDGSPHMFDASSFARLAFLEGRWRGTGPDGAEFFEQYTLAGPTELRSDRYADVDFSERTDGSTVVLDKGVILASWGPFSWQATMVTETQACFDPVQAPSAFCWERTGPDELQVTQRWSDSDGVAQSFVLTLSRIED